MSKRIQALCAFSLAMAGAAVAEDDTASPVVELPPMLVEVTVKPRPWLYAEMPGVVVLSRCNESTTLEFMRGEFRTQQLLKFILPENLRAGFSQPLLMILSTQAQTATAQQVLMKDGAQGVPAPAPNRPAQSAADVFRAARGMNIVAGRGFAGSPAMVEAIRFVSNLRLDDVDEMATFLMVDENSFDGDVLKPSAGVFHQFVARETPALPAWLRTGIETLFRSSAFGTSDITVGPLLWVSEAERKSLLTDKYYPRILFPVEQLFETDGPTDDDTSDNAARWRAEAGLFVRWALRGGDAARVADFWKFVDRAVAGGGVNEALLKDTYRLSYSDLRDTLSDALADPKFSEEGWKITGKIERAPSIKVREATDKQVAALRDEWERLEVTYVAQKHPDYLQNYRDQAEKDFTTAYEAGNRDPGFLATYGLYLVDAGRDAAAAPILEEAIRAPDARSRTLFEMSRIRYQAALANPEGAGGKLNREQVAHAVELLQRARKLEPANVAVYQLIAAAWTRSEQPPTAADMESVNEGMRLFPKDPILATLRSRIP